MLTYATHIDFHDEEHGRGVVRVQTYRCWYRVAVQKDECVVLGPGVEETISSEDIPPDLSFEARALCAVLIFEETER